MEDNKETYRLSYIDGLKGLLVIPIILYHYFTSFCASNVSLIPFRPTFIFSKGFIAVELYFAISGFLTARKYFGFQNSITFRKFIFPKLRRTVPCLCVSNVIIVICMIISNQMPNLWTLMGSCTPFYTGWITNAGPYAKSGWFLSILFLCYTIYYFLLKIKNKQIYYVVCGLIILIGINGYQLDIKLPLLYTQTCRGYMAFFIGALLFHLLESDFNKKGISVIGIIFLAIIFALELKFNNVVGNVTFFTNFVIIPIVLLVVTSIKWIQNILSLRPMLYLGKISMSIYLIHTPTIRIIKLVEFSTGGWKEQPKNILFFLVVTAIEIVVCIAEYELLEKRLFKILLPKINHWLKRSDN